MSNVKWPPEVIDGEQLHELLGYESRDAAVIGDDAYTAVLNFETAVDQAWARGKLSRLTATDPAGKVVAYGYKRAELRKLFHSSLTSWDLAKTRAPMPTTAAPITPAHSPPTAQLSPPGALNAPRNINPQRAPKKATAQHPEELAKCPSCQQSLRWPGNRPTGCACGALRAQREVGRSGQVDIVVYMQGKEGWRFPETT